MTEMSHREGFQRDKKKLLGVMDIFIILIVVIVSQVFAYIKTDQTVEYMQFIVCQLYSNNLLKGKGCCCCFVLFYSALFVLGSNQCPHIAFGCPT